MPTRLPSIPPAARALPLALAAWLATAAPARAADTCAAAPTGADADADADAATAQRLLRALAETTPVPGMGAAVWRDGQVVWTGCVGWRDLAARRPVERETVFRLASVSKLFAATAAYRLAEQGRLGLDEPVAALLPWLRSDWQPFTLRQLAAHTSGLPHYGDEYPTLGRIRYPTSRAATALFAARPQRTPPGTAYGYSSWGYTLIGALVEERSGRHFLDYVAEEIAPGLDVYADGAAPAGRESLLYAIDGGAARELPRLDFSYTWAGGGLAATPESLVRFGGRVLQGRIVSPAGWERMREPTRLADGGAAREGEYPVGFGWRLGRDHADGAPIAHHAGTTAGARSQLTLWPQQATAAALLSNASWVASMEPTVAMLAAPFRPRPAGLVAAPCPRVAHYRGRLADAPLQGQALFRLERGRCVGELIADGPLQAHFASATAWSDRRLRIVALDADGSLARAALVTPYGLYELRADAGRTWSARLSPNNRLTLSF